MSSNNHNDLPECWRCQGTGDDASGVPCAVCHGTGWAEASEGVAQPDEPEETDIEDPQTEAAQS